MERVSLIVPVFLLLLVTPAVTASELQATIGCSAFNVTVGYDPPIGPYPQAEAICSGHVVALPNLTLTESYWLYLNVTDPLRHAHWNNVYPPNSSSTLLIAGKVYAGVNILELLKWALEGQNPVGLSADVYVWAEAPIPGHNETSSVLLKGSWEGTAPLMVDWSRVISLTLLQAIILINVAIGTFVGAKVRNERLAGLSISTGVIMGYLAYTLPYFGIHAQLGFFIVLEVFLLVIWLSVMTGTSPTSGRRNLVGNLTVALFLGGLVFVFLWAIITDNGPFTIGTLLVMLPTGAYLFRFISQGLFEANARGELEKINPRPLGLLLLMPYLPQFLLWGGILESARLTLVATLVFLGSVSIGLVSDRLLDESSPAQGRYI